MLKFNVTKSELKSILENVYLSEMQERLITYRMRDLSIIQMADLEHCSPSKINKEIHKLKCKIEKIK